MIMDHKIKLAHKKISSSEDIVERVHSDYTSPHMCLTLKTEEGVVFLLLLLFGVCVCFFFWGGGGVGGGGGALHDILAQGDAPPYQVWLQKVMQFRRHHPDTQTYTVISTEPPPPPLQYNT